MEKVTPSARAAAEAPSSPELTKTSSASAAGPTTGPSQSIPSKEERDFLMPQARVATLAGLHSLARVPA